MSKKSPQDRSQEVLMFRWGVISDLTRELPGGELLTKRIREKAAQHYVIPGSTRTRIAAETIRGWLHDYKKGGFEALRPKVRKDIGKSRQIPDSVVEALLELKREKPSLTARDAISKVRGKLKVGVDVSLPQSNVYRLFHGAGLMDVERRTAAKQDFRRFSYPNAGDLWMADVMHFIGISDGNRKRKTYLIAFIDDASRVVPFAEFHFTENASAFLQTFKQAVMRRGLPERLYVDNGSAMRSKALALVCAKLNIALVHSRPYAPQGKGKIERYFRTCRSRLLPNLSENDTTSLDSLNRALRVWIEGEYHHTPHNGINQMTPLDKWATCAQKVRLIDAATDLEDVFLFEDQRRVNNDRTVRLRNHLYEVEPHLIREKVVLRYNPETLGTRPIEVVFDGKKTQAHLLDIYANARSKRHKPPSGLNFKDFPTKDN